MPDKIQVHGVKELIAALNQYNVDLENGLTDVLKEVGRATTKAIRAELLDAASPNNHGAPGNPPMVQFSREKRAGVEPRKGRAKRTYAQVELKRDAIRFHIAPNMLGKPLSLRLAIHFPGSNGFYAHMMEYGTSKMQPRPFYHRIIDGVESVVSEKMDKAAQKAQDKFNK